MSFWELLGALAGAASIISVALAFSSMYNGRATRRLIREVHSDTQNRIDGTQPLIAELHANTLAVLERMDERAKQRHREIR